MDNAQQAFKDLREEIRNNAEVHDLTSLRLAITNASLSGKSAIVWKKKLYSLQIEVLREQGLCVNARTAGGYDIDWSAIYEEGY